ncbi:MAG: hypothetical protein H7A37_08035 [Chlamydiales bacterium]|nr:hypothetical protein [Chlamydiia bacterium]MCP5508230.1 hypothetical protein [Chlamydiales bacterium]
MENLLQTIVIAFVIFGGALALLGLGWLVTGKKKLRGGTCGRDPTKKQDDPSCQSRCELCDKDKE